MKYEDFGYIPVALELSDEITNFDVTINGTYTLPEGKSKEVFIFGEGGDFYIGGNSNQNIKILSGSTIILDVSNPSSITVSGNNVDLHIMILG